jgi:hypothetical protein
MPQQIEIPGQGIVEFPDGMSDAQIAAAIKQNMPSLGAVGNTVDAAKGLGSGVVRGTAYMVGQGGDINELARKGIGKLESSGVVTNEQVEGAKGQVAGITDWVKGKLGMEPGGFQSQDYGSQKIMEKIDKTTGLPIASYQPQSAYGKVAQTVGTFAPGAVMGGGGILRGAIAPGVVSELARMGAEGTAWETPAAVAGAVVGGAAIPNKLTITSDQLKKAASGNYKDPAVTGLRVDPAGPSRLADDIVTAIEKGGARQHNAGGVYSTVDELRNLPNTTTGQKLAKAGLNPSATVEDIKGVRTVLNNAANDARNPLTGALDTSGKAAQTAARKVTDYLDNVPAADVRAGNAAAASSALREATKNYSQAKKLEIVETLLGRAEHRAGSTYSGGNVNNTSRQELRKILDNRIGQRFSPAEKAQAERTVMGTNTGNLARLVGKALAPTGALALAPASGATLIAEKLGGDPQTAAAIGGGLAVIGMGARGIGNASTARQARMFSELVAKGAPAAQTKAAMRKSGIEPSARNVAIVQALIAGREAQPMPAPPVPKPVYQFR